MKNDVLDDFESELVAEFENEEWVSDLNEERAQQFMQASDATMKKDKRINIRMSSRDLDAIKQRALEEGIPYQTLISSVLHKFASGSYRSIQ